MLETKDQVFQVFQQFQARVERETDRKLKNVRLDNGGEYRGPFEAYWKAQGIKLEKTVPKTPQLNGVAKDQTCMLSQEKLPWIFWVEAMFTTVHIINLSPSVPIEGDIPQRVWTGKDVPYKHLRVFG